MELKNPRPAPIGNGEPEGRCWKFFLKRTPGLLGPHFARAIEVLRKAGVKVVGLDYLFSISAESWLKRLNLPNRNESRIYDVPLRAQLAAGQVVLASNMVIDDNGKRKILLPIWDYWNSLSGKLDDIGLTNFYNDPDGTIRQFSPF